MSSWAPALWNDGQVARVASSYSAFDADGVCRVTFGNPTGVPPAIAGKLYVVSGLVAQAMTDRDDVVAPATGHPLAVRKDGQVFSVPGFCK